MEASESHPHHRDVTAVGVVVTSFNQGSMVAEAVRSVTSQTIQPDKLVVVDDGSTDALSRVVLADLERDGVRVIRQRNRGVSAARNKGIAAIDTTLVAVLDGDDRYRPEFLAEAQAPFVDPDVVAASAWLNVFGTFEAIVRPPGGRLPDFLARNGCPASAMFRRTTWRAVGGYAEDLRDGYEDWDFFLRLLTNGGQIRIVPKPLIDYRTNHGSANVDASARRIRLYQNLIDRHSAVFTAHARAALLAQEQISIERLTRWEAVMVANPTLDAGEATFGDGGMAALVRVAAARSAAASREHL